MNDCVFMKGGGIEFVRTIVASFVVAILIVLVVLWFA
jgi:hypothetical protein